MGACWTVATQLICLPIFYHSISKPADLLPLIPACLLVLCISICHTCVYGVSLSAVPSGLMPHYQPCPLVCCLTIGHAFWCSLSLSTMPICLAPHYRPCLLVSCHCNQHFYKLSANRRMATNMVLLVQRCHKIRLVC